ncbi:DNA mismatch repair endonuclease MutL [Fimbriiglobus ruber]|uniref:DNA mismatch repair protein MutL n=1 Tax=Fimbriiglobus ruber TaxID=1908690 RepID=A0A225DPR4_9BACT|nr:DNA mismatch repair endonuclease MutL [Fimbriiglobus ruber]OWK43291.1 DNA mismatch repair protein MutL [Fimbriiglobus ruber]
MARIRQLDPIVVTKIAAGEVIERPASVVKELLENSVDAGSTRIDIDLEQGGTELIRVVDDGGGIDSDDLPLAFISHATSKLTEADDLFRISTMGFRGEALASIGGVAQVTLQSRTPDRPSGAEIRCDGGELSPIRPWGGSSGTRIEVRHLFHNFPVRKKFLKSIATELGHVCETVTRLALANPGLHLVLRHNNKMVYEIPASASLPDRVALFFGGEVRDALYEVDSGEAPIRLTGFIADPKCDRGNPKLQYLFVNGRWFRDRSVGHALQEAYRGLLMTGRYAAGFLFLTVPPDQVDVNVHPTKAEVRFRENSLIYSLVRATIKTRLLKENLVPKLQVPAEAASPAEEKWELRSPPPAATDSLFGPRRAAAEKTLAPWELPESAPLPRSSTSPSFSRPETSFEPRGTPSPSLRFAEGAYDRPSASPASVSVVAKSEVTELTQQTIPPSSPFPPDDELRPSSPSALPVTQEKEPEPPENEDVFHVPATTANEALREVAPFSLPALPPGSALQVHDAYLVLETPEGMLVIDQHALHERILYEQLRRRVRDGKLEVQRLLIPEPIDLPAEQAAAVLDARDALAELGLEVTDFGGNTVLLSSYPTLLARRAPHLILRGVIDYLVTKDRPPAKEVLLDHLLATMACKAAVKAGDRLTQEEIAHLLHLRQMAEDSHHCPHGRPTSLLFSRQELDRQFKRI